MALAVAVAHPKDPRRLVMQLMRAASAANAPQDAKPIWADPIRFRKMLEQTPFAVRDAHETANPGQSESQEETKAESSVSTQGTEAEGTIDGNGC